MFYSNNDNYMQDLYAYNQMTPNNTYNSFMGSTMPGAGNENMGFTNNMSGMFMPNMGGSMPNQNRNMFQGNPNNMVNPNNMNTQNPNNLYPSIYRIVNPVVNRVVSGSNVPYLTEDSLNNMVDTVFNIVEGQIDWEDEMEMASQNESVNRGTTTTTITATQTPSSNTNPNTRTTTTTDTRNTMNTTTTNNPTTNNSSSNITMARRRNRDNSLLRDLIKILILRQIFSRNWMAQMPFNYQNQFTYNPNFMQQGGFSSGF